MEIVVLYGGESAERAVSLVSGERVAAALTAAGHKATLLDYMGEPLRGEHLSALRQVDAVFLALHGGRGENGGLQAELEAKDIWHYTGSDPVAAALAMDKPLAKKLVALKGVPVARGGILSPDATEPPLPFPFVLKPIAGGSSVGLQCIKTPEDWQKVTPFAGILYEEYLPGREYTVGILDGELLPAVEICPLEGEYDYAHKYEPGASREICPAPLPPHRAKALAELAAGAFRALGLRDYGRIDVREDAEGRFCFLEANTLPGMTPTSLFPLAAATAGYDFTTLCERMAILAKKRKK